MKKALTLLLAGTLVTTLPLTTCGGRHQPRNRGDR